MKVKNLGLIISTAVFLLGAVGIFAVVTTMSQSVKELAEEKIKGQAEVILANANVNNNSAVTVPILYYDQKMDNCVDLYSTAARAAASWRQFEWTECGYQNFRIEKELVEGELSSDFLPIPADGELVTNRGLVDGFKRWFNQVDGKSKSYAGTLTLTYDADKTSFNYRNDNFYPLDDFTMNNTEGAWVPKDESVNNDGRNHLFTLNLGIPIQVLANGSEKFEITADDDTWVFVDKKLVIDLGGIHESEKASFEIRSNGEVYMAVKGERMAYTGVTLSEKDTAVIRVFHADRDSGTGSTFAFSLVNMVPNIVDATLAKGSSGIEVAYDPENPSYVAPLGESLTVRPNRAKVLTTSVVVQGLIAGGLAIVVMASVVVGIRVVRRPKNGSR